MKSAIILAISVILPVSVWADSSIRLRLSGDNFDLIFQGSDEDHCYHDNGYDHNDYVIEGDSWFEDCNDDGYSKVSMEYQWTVRGSSRVLVYRRVTFHPVNSVWFFAPWAVVEKVCHPSCHVHHKHVFHKAPRQSHNWKRYRRNDGGKVSYYYEYQEPPRKFSRAQPKVYRYEYRPEIRYSNHRDYPRNEDKHRDYKFDNSKNRNHRNDHNYQHKESYKKSSENPRQSEPKKSLKKVEKSNKGNEKEMKVISGREYVRH